MAEAALAIAQVSGTDAPPAREAVSVSINGTSASTIVLSPGVAPPSLMVASVPACTAATSSSGEILAVSLTALPIAVRADPHSAPEVPPALSDQASPAFTRRVWAPAPAASAALAARAAPLAPRTMPCPWSPSPATASRSPNCCSFSLAQATIASSASASRAASSWDSGAITVCSPTSTSPTELGRWDDAPRRSAGVSTGAAQYPSSSESRKVPVGDSPSMPRLVTCSPT